MAMICHDDWRIGLNDDLHLSARGRSRSRHLCWPRIIDKRARKTSKNDTTRRKRHFVMIFQGAEGRGSHLAININIYQDLSRYIKIYPHEKPRLLPGISTQSNDGCF